MLYHPTDTGCFTSCSVMACNRRISLFPKFEIWRTISCHRCLKMLRHRFWCFLHQLSSILNQMSHGCLLKKRCKDICCSVSGMIFDRRLLFLLSLLLLLSFLLLRRIIISPLPPQSPPLHDFLNAIFSLLWRSYWL